MSPRTKEQIKKIRANKKELIMNAALEEFAEFGYHRTSIDKVSKRANISKGLLYNYFENKEDLLKSIIIKGLKLIVEIFDPNKDGFLTEDKFEFFIEQTFEILQKNMPFWKLYFSIITKAGVVEIIKEPMEEYLKPFINTMIDYYNRHEKKNPVAHALLFGATLDGISLNYIMQPEMFPLEEIKKLIIDKFK